MRILSLNIAGTKDLPSRIELIARYINLQAPDVVALQEVLCDGGANQATQINEKLDNPFEHMCFDSAETYQPSTRQPYTEGLALLTRQMLKDHKVWRLRQADDDRHKRIAQCVELTTNIKIINVHFSNNQHSTEQLQEVIKNDQGKSVIVGDFNIFSLTEDERVSYRGRYKDSYEFQKYISFPAENLTLDYALIPSQYSFEALATQDGLSDHAAVRYDISGFAGFRSNP